MCDKGSENLTSDFSNLNYPGIHVYSIIPLTVFLLASEAMAASETTAGLKIELSALN